MPVTMDPTILFVHAFTRSNVWSRIGAGSGGKEVANCGALLLQLGIGGGLVFDFCFEIGDAIEKNVLDE